MTLLWWGLGAIVAFFALVVVVVAVVRRCYIVVGPDKAIVKTGWGAMDVKTAGGMLVYPVINRVEYMDLTLKSFEISRQGSEGLICKDNIRADIKVAFFIRVNNKEEEMKEVAQSIGAKRCSELDTLRELFDAKFSEALKTVGKQFDFVELYDQRDKFKDEILKVIGTDLNGYCLDDAAIDYLEQTPIEMLSPTNILDAEGIKKITELTANEKVKENQFTRDKEKTLKKQDVEAEETILALERQRVEAVEKQKREIAEVSAREQASAKKVEEEQRLEGERARIATEEELGVAEENKLRQVLVAQRNKEKTDAVELERVNRDRDLEQTERLRVVGVAEVEKEKAIETEKRKHPRSDSRTCRRRTCGCRRTRTHQGHRRVRDGRTSEKGPDHRCRNEGRRRVDSSNEIGSSRERRQRIVGRETSHRSRSEKGCGGTGNGCCKDAGRSQSRSSCCTGIGGCDRSRSQGREFGKRRNSQKLSSWKRRRLQKPKASKRKRQRSRNKVWPKPTWTWKSIAAKRPVLPRKPKR